MIFVPALLPSLSAVALAKVDTLSIPRLPGTRETGPRKKSAKRGRPRVFPAGSRQALW